MGKADDAQACKLTNLLRALKAYLSWFEQKTSPTGLFVCTLGFQVAVLLQKVTEVLGSRDLLKGMGGGRDGHFRLI